MKIVIMNAYVMNNGDAALSIALYQQLCSEGYEVVISTMNYLLAHKKYPSLPLVKSPYEFNWLENFCMRVKNKLKLPLDLEKVFIKRKVRMEKKFHNIDAVISVGGGYINSYYGIETKLYTVECLRKRNNNCPVFMYSQSVGPLSKVDKKRLDYYISQYELFMVRDSASYERCKEYSNVILTNDSAFLLKPESAVKGRKVVAVSVRKWDADGRNIDLYFQMIQRLVSVCICEGYMIEFISTCQGEGYTDHLVAQEILKGFTDEERQKIQVNTEYYSLYQLRGKLKEYDFIIGTRLHMCILGMLSGTPAFNISYEEKGKECYRYLGMEKYSIDYNEKKETAEKILGEFLNNMPEIKKQLADKMENAHKEALSYFEIWKEKMEECCEQNRKNILEYKM